MRRVPEWLPEVLAWHNYNNRTRLAGAAVPGFEVLAYPAPAATRMDLIVYESPALIHGLLMTEITTERNWNDPNKKQRIERFFFGYRCGCCREVFLIREHTQRMEELERDIGHECDPSDLRRAVRNARDMGRERGECIMEGTNGYWWPEKRNRF